MMTKKHFQAFVDTIKATENATDAERFADLCIELVDNPNFDAARFYAACGLNAIGERNGATTSIPVAIKLKAKNGKNGNPRRVYVVLDAVTGDIIDTMDEGYKNDINALHARYPCVGFPCEFPTTPGEYRSLVKLGETLRAKKEGGSA